MTNQEIYSLAKLKLTIDELKQIVYEKETDRKNIWQNKAGGVPVLHCGTFVSYQCSTVEDVAKVLNVFEPFKTMDCIKTSGKSYYLNRPAMYRIDIKNGFNKIEIKITFGLVEMDVCVTLNFDKFPQSIRKMFDSGTREIYKNELHYLEGRKANEIVLRTKMFPVGVDFIPWYGGDRTCLDADFIERFISLVKQELK